MKVIPRKHPATSKPSFSRFIVTKSVPYTDLKTKKVIDLPIRGYLQGGGRRSVVVQNRGMKRVDPNPHAEHNLEVETKKAKRQLRRFQQNPRPVLLRHLSRQAIAQAHELAEAA